MKRKSLNLAMLLVAGVLTVTTCTIWQEKVHAAEAGKGRITVNGEGAVLVKPDIAYLHLGVSTEDADPKKAQDSNTAQMNRILKALVDMGIESEDIQTSNYSIYPQRDYQNGNKMIGYTVNNNVKVTIRKLDRVGEVLDKAIEAGANIGDGVQFSISDTDEYYQQALTLAIQNATAKADTIGSALGRQIAAPVEVTEMSGNITPYMYRQAEMKSDSFAAGAVPVQAGDLTVTAAVQMVFEY